MTADVSIEKSPNVVLANLVVAKLKEKGSITEEQIDEALAKLKTGTASSEDWRLWAELALAMKEENGDYGQD